ncbi:MAG TPA: NUDIX domain-containing protein, partial [Streptosporangiaceae bacterium]|nr:NUDIX domain-containing protein [Streptosporangiaceae bacterium]
MSHFDEGSLASETTRCLRQLGDLEQARQQAERIISLRPSHRTRSRAFGQLALASVLIAQQEPDQAVGIAADVLNATQSLGSYLVISQLIQLQRQLEPYSGNAVVAEFLDCLQDAVRDRLAFYQLTAGRILLVDPTYKPDWDLPGGMAEANEPPADAVRRELREELGLGIQVGDLLCVDWVSPHGPWDDLLNFIFDGGTLTAS